MMKKIVLPLLTLLFLFSFYFFYERYGDQLDVKQNTAKKSYKIKPTKTTIKKSYKSIHVFVALCDNLHQGIAPVPPKIGNGKDPKNNLYWGAGYGVKTYFKRHKNWKFLKTIASENPNVLERILFKHKTQNVYLLADAYDGEEIKTCIEDYLESSNGQLPIEVLYNKKPLYFGGNADLLAYIGHDGLMEFQVTLDYKKVVSKPKDVIMLACYSKEYFSKEIKKAQANPILWTTHLLSPEAYTLEAGIQSWIDHKNRKQIKEAAAQAYNKYQKCGIRGARNLFTSEW